MTPSTRCGERWEKIVVGIASFPALDAPQFGVEENGRGKAAIGWGRTPSAHTYVREAPNMGGISLGGILVIIGIVVAFLWSVVGGVIIALVGLIAFGGFAKGKWY
jgi:hypothetical protein